MVFLRRLVLFISLIFLLVLVGEVFSGPSVRHGLRQYRQHDMHHGMGHMGKGSCPQVRFTVSAPDEFLKLENPAGLTILGGQEGIINSRYLIGIQKSDYLWKLSKMARRFLLRTCCYSVDIKTAKLILSSQLNYLSRADNWIRILPINTNFFYIGKFKHPLESNESNLEPERKEGNLFKRAYRDGPTKIATNSSLKIIIFIITRLGIRKKLIEE